MSYHDAVCLPAPGACRACGGPKLFQIVPLCEACLSQTILATLRVLLPDNEED